MILCRFSLSKRIAVSVLAVLMAIAFMPLITFSSANAEETGEQEYTGSEETLSGTYTISNADQLRILSDKVNGGNTYKGVTFKLTQDINLSGNFTPIGTGYFSKNHQSDNKPFKGNFNGNGHTITGLKVVPTSEEESIYEKVKNNENNKEQGKNDYNHNEEKFSSKGLFGLVEGGTIENLTIDGAEIKGYNAEAAVVGAVRNGGTIQNVTVENSTIEGVYENAGAVLGRVDEPNKETTHVLDVENCTVNNCKVILPQDFEYQNGAGGLIGRTQRDHGSKIIGNKVTNTTVKAYRKAAGLVGYILQPADIQLTGNEIDADITINENAKNWAGDPYYGIITAEIQGHISKDDSKDTTANERGYESYDGKSITIKWVHKDGTEADSPQNDNVDKIALSTTDGAANKGKIKVTAGNKTETIYADADSQIDGLKKTIADLQNQLNAAQSQSTKANTDNDAKIKTLNDQLAKAQSDLKAAQEQQANTAAAYTAPGKVTNLKAKAGKKKITLTWKKASNATGYKIYRASKKSGKYKYYKAVKGLKYVNKSLKKGKKYYYKVRAYKTIKDGQLFGAYSNIAGANVK